MKGAEAVKKLAIRLLVLVSTMILASCANLRPQIDYGLDDASLFEAIHRGEARSALAAYEAQAEKLAARGDPVGAAWAFSRGMSTAARVGEYEKGIKLGHRALDVLAGRPADVKPFVLHILGNLYAQVGDGQTAKLLANQGLALVPTDAEVPRRPLWEGMLRRDLGYRALADGDRTVALARFRQSVQSLQSYRGFEDGNDEPSIVIRRELAYTLRGLASVEPAAEAVRSLRRARWLTRKNREPETELAIVAQLGNLALGQGAYSDAERLFQEATGMAANMNYAPSHSLLRAGLARALAGQGRTAESLHEFQTAIALIENVRGQLQTASLRGGFAENKQEIYYGAIRAALRIRQIAEAFSLAERARARAFLDLLGTQTMLTRVARPDLVAAESELRTSLSRLASDRTPSAGFGGEPPPTPATDRGVRDIVVKYDDLVQRLRVEDPEQASLLVVEPVAVPEVQALLPTDTAMLAYLVLPEQTICWVVSRSTVTAVALPIGRAQLQSQVEVFRRAIAEGKPLPMIRTQGRALYQALIAPLESHVDRSRLLIVPHDVLHYLPFAALRTADDHWMVERYVLATVPSASAMKYLDGKAHTASGRPLIVGDPELGLGRELPFAELEARMVAEKFSGSTLLVGARATKDNLKLLGRNAGLIHLAMHAELDVEDPLSSALRLAPSATDDGRLSVREIFRLDLRAALVVLSACETALGRLSSGDELIGLQRAFLYAGTPRIITSLWKVEDQATYELMRMFYEDLPSRGPADALANAQRRLLTERPEPFSWAGFVFTGVPDTPSLP